MQDEATAIEQAADARLSDAVAAPFSTAEALQGMQEAVRSEIKAAVSEYTQAVQILGQHCLDTREASQGLLAQMQRADATARGHIAAAQQAAQAARERLDLPGSGKGIVAAAFDDAENVPSNADA